MNRKRFFKYTTALIVSIALTVLLLCIIDNHVFAALLSCFISIFILLLCDYRENIVMLAFLICFFVFLIGRPFADEIIGYSGYSVIHLGQETKTFVYLCLLISLLSIICGYIVCRLINAKKKQDRVRIKENDGQMVFAFRRISRSITIIFYVLAVIENFSRLLYIKSVGYTASYALDYDYGLPYGLHYLVILAPVAFALFLATLPRRREAIIPIILFIISNMLFALSGNRFEIISCFLMLIIYCIWRNETDKIKWITNKQLLCVLAIIPLVMVLMQNMIYWREGNDVKTEADPIVSFLYSVGGSASLIGAVEEHGDDDLLSGEYLYSFGGVWRGLNGNIVSKTLGLGGSYGGQTIEYARDAHSLSSTLTYYYAPEKYLSGYGLGGCYIAELYRDFSMVGVVIGNIIIGVILGLFRKLEKNRLLYNFLCFYTMMLFLRLPRDSFDYPITSLLNLKNLIFIVFVFLLAGKMCKNKNMEERPK